jgi:hypothetical protein
MHMHAFMAVGSALHPERRGFRGACSDHRIGGRTASVTTMLAVRAVQVSRGQ